MSCYLTEIHHEVVTDNKYSGSFVLNSYNANGTSLSLGLLNQSVPLLCPDLSGFRSYNIFNLDIKVSISSLKDSSMLSNRQFRVVVVREFTVDLVRRNCAKASFFERFLLGSSFADGYTSVVGDKCVWDYNGSYKTSGELVSRYNKNNDIYEGGLFILIKIDDKYVKLDTERFIINIDFSYNYVFSGVDKNLIATFGKVTHRFTVFRNGLSVMNQYFSGYSCRSVSINNSQLGDLNAKLVVDNLSGAHNYQSISVSNNEVVSSKDSEPVVDPNHLVDFVSLSSNFSSNNTSTTINDSSSLTGCLDGMGLYDDDDLFDFNHNDLID